MYRTNLTAQIGKETGGLASKSIHENFTSLSHYEASFHFLVKRIHNFANLRSNIFTSTLQFNRASRAVDGSRKASLVSSADTLVLLATSLNRSHTVASGVLNPFYAPLNYTNPQQANPLTLSASKDIISPSWDYDFLTDDQLEFMYNTTNMLVVIQTSTNFFKVNSGVGYKVSSDLDFVITPSGLKVDHQPLFTLLYNESELLKDVYLLSLLWGKRRIK